MLNRSMDKAFIESTLSAILNHLKLNFSKIAMGEKDGVLRADIESDDPSRIIGWHGETLNAIQHILKAIVRTKEKMDRQPFIVLDTDGYRRAQEEKVCRIAEQKADFVRRTGSRVALPPMSPYFRRIVHLHVANAPSLSDMVTESIGEGDYRQIILRLKNIREKSLGGGELSPVIEEAGEEEGLENLDI